MIQNEDKIKELIASNTTREVGSFPFLDLPFVLFICRHHGRRLEPCDFTRRGLQN